MNYFINNLFIKTCKSCFIFLFLTWISACSNSNQLKVNNEMPTTILWAWERPEDLRFIDTKKIGVAFLAQTLILQNDEVLFRPRRQKLEVSPKTYLIAVTRIETNKTPTQKPKLSDSQRKKVVNLIKNSLKLPNVKAVQIDFDVVVSEREFYKDLVKDLRKNLPKDFPLTITSLASWCIGDTWFADFPIDEAVPMAFRMGADDKKVRNFLANGNDWNENLCKGSYGVSIDEPLKMEFNENRRIFYFNDDAWNKSDLEKLNR